MITALALICGCDVKYYTSGVILNEEKVLKIIPGKSKIDDVESVWITIGTIGR